MTTAAATSVPCSAPARSAPHLHASTAAWSLRAARRRLAELVDLERAGGAAHLLDAGPVSSPIWGVRRSSGEHADPVLTGCTITPVREIRWGDLAARLRQRLTWLADRTAPGAGEPLDRLVARIPQMPPATAATIARHLADEDAWIRQALRADPAETLLPGAACPVCGQRQLRLQTAPPPPEQTVICRACDGIWTRETVLTNARNAHTP